MDEAISLLEECLRNGNDSYYALWAWFVGERDTITRIVKDYHANQLIKILDDALNPTGEVDKDGVKKWFV